MDPKKTGAYLASLRRGSGLTQQEAAQQLDVSNKTVSKWESGGGFPDITVLPALAELYGVTADDILAGETGPRPAAPADTAAGRRRLLSRLRMRFDVCFAVSLALCVMTLLRVPYVGLAALPLSAALLWIGDILVAHPVRYGGVEADGAFWTSLYRKLLAATVLQWYALGRITNLGRLDMARSDFGARFELRHTGDDWKPLLFLAGALLAWFLLQRALRRMAGPEAQLLPGRWKTWLPGRWQTWLAWGLWALLLLAAWRILDGAYHSAAAPWIERYGEDFMRDARFDKWPILRQRRDAEMGGWYLARQLFPAVGALSGLGLAAVQLAGWKKRRRPLAETAEE